MRKSHIHHDSATCSLLLQVTPGLRSVTQFQTYEESSTDEDDEPPGRPHAPPVPHLQPTPPPLPPEPRRPQRLTSKPDRLQYSASPRERKRQKSVAKSLPKTRIPDPAVASPGTSSAGSGGSYQHVRNCHGRYIKQWVPAND